MITCQLNNHKFCKCWKRTLSFKAIIWDSCAVIPLKAVEKYSNSWPTVPKKVFRELPHETLSRPRDWKRFYFDLLFNVLPIYTRSFTSLHTHKTIRATELRMFPTIYLKEEDAATHANALMKRPTKYIILWSAISPETNADNLASMQVMTRLEVPRRAQAYFHSDS